MGNSCEGDNICYQPQSQRESLRGRSLSENSTTLSMKTLIQIKKGKLTDEYQVKQILGQGSFGSVYKIVQRKTKIVRAAKKIQKKKRNIQNLEQFLILKKLDHPNIVQIHDIYADKKYIYIVMDCCEGGQLFNRIVQKGNLTQNQARAYLKQLLSAISHCHSQNIMHRDLKPENIMFLNQNDKDLKIIDFGVGTSYKQNKSMSLKVGSIFYMAPEVINRSYNQKCDVWSLGIILYVLLIGKPPFIGKTDKQTADLIKIGKVSYNDKKWQQISPSAKHLVQKMLQVNHFTRISAKQCLNHPWIRLQSQQGNKKLYIQGELFRIKNFYLMNKFQTAIMIYIGHNFIHNELLKDLQNKFKSLDQNGDGRISWKQFLDCYNQYMPLEPQQNIKDMFKSLDKNNSGFIDYSQFIACSIDIHYVNSENLIQKAFNMIDRDHNGKLSKQQLLQSFGGCNSEIYNQIINQFDIDHDGMISKYQFKLAMKQLIKK